MAIKVTNIEEFNKELKLAMDNTLDGAREVLSKTSFDTFRGLQRRTPKETNRAASGWVPSVDKEPSEWKPQKGRDSYSLHDDRELNRIEADSVVHLSNNVEYIIPLDEGHSNQASTGIINFVLSRAKAMLTSLIRKENRRVIK